MLDRRSKRTISLLLTIITLGTVLCFSVAQAQEAAVAVPDEVKSNPSQISPSSAGFDWKWFLGIMIPLLFAIVVASVKFHGDLKSQQRDIHHLQLTVARIEEDLKSNVARIEENLKSNTTRIEGNLAETNRRISTLESKVQTVEVQLTKMNGDIQLINQKIDTILERLPK